MQPDLSLRANSGLNIAHHLTVCSADVQCTKQPVCDRRRTVQSLRWTDKWQRVCKMLPRKAPVTALCAPHLNKLHVRHLAYAVLAALDFPCLQYRAGMRKC